MPLRHWRFDALKTRQNGRHFPDMFKCNFLNENASISIKISESPKFVPKCPINIIPAMFQIMAWRWLGDKPLSEPMVVSLLTHEYIFHTSLGHSELTKSPWKLGHCIWFHQRKTMSMVTYLFNNLNWSLLVKGAPGYIFVFRYIGIPVLTRRRL